MSRKVSMTPLPDAPPPPLPDTPPPPLPELDAPPPQLPEPAAPAAFDLGAAQGHDPAPAAPAKPEKVEAMPPEVLIRVVAELSSLGMGARREQYVTAFTGNPVVQLGVEMSQITDTLAEMGFGMGSGKPPPWLSLALGLGALTGGIIMTRNEVMRSAIEPTNENRRPVPDPGGADAGGAIASALGQFQTAEPDAPAFTDPGGHGGGFGLE